MMATLDSDPREDAHSLEQALRRFNYVLEKFGVTQKNLGVTAHGLRHQALIEKYEELTGHPAPVRGGENFSSKTEDSAREAVSELAGHGRRRASNAYLGATLNRKLQTD